MGLVNTPPPLHQPKQSVKATKSSITAVQTADQAKNQKRMDRANSLNSIAQIVSGGLLMFGQYADSETVLTYAPGICFQSAVIAEDHEAFATFLDQAEVATPYLGLAMAAIPMVLQVMANHGRIKPEKASGMGVMSPDMLERRAQTRLARRQTEILRQQLEAEEEAQAVYEQAQEELRRQEAAYASMNGSENDL